MRDVVIVGGGPAGLTMASYLADAGIQPLVLEKLNHPRPHVGESLMPSTVRVLREIGFHGIMEDAGFTSSGGVVYHPPDREDVILPYAGFPQEGIDQPHTYHVDRGRFDMLLMKHAEAKGAKIVQGVGVDEVLFDANSRAHGVSVSVGGARLDLESRIVVDAAGRTTRIGRQLELRRNHPVLDQFALHAWCVDVDRGPPDTERYTHIYFLPELRGWAWQAPVADAYTSVGIVAARSKYSELHLGVDEFFRFALGTSPKLAHAMRAAERINDIKGEINYSYSLDRVCGDGWLAVGDAARFIDPVFSSGVSVAMHSAKFAAERVEAALANDDTSRSMFLPYEDMMLSGAAVWDDFVRLYYRLLPAFTELLESKEHRHAVMRMIQGDTWRGSDAAWLAEMRAMVRKVEEADSHPWRDELVDLPF